MINTALGILLGATAMYFLLRADSDYGWYSFIPYSPHAFSDEQERGVAEHQSDNDVACPLCREPVEFKARFLRTVAVCTDDECPVSDIPIDGKWAETLHELWYE